MSEIEFLKNERVEWRRLGEIAELTAGGDVPKSNFSKNREGKYSVPIYGNGIGDNALYGYTDKCKVKAPAITLSVRGTIGYCRYIEEDFYPIVRLIVISKKESLSYVLKFVKYYLDTLKIQGTESGIPQLTIPMIRNIEIPIPPLKTQQKIVETLDKFSNYATELRTKLHAELQNRIKQHAFYRDKLLSEEYLCKMSEKLDGFMGENREVRFVTLGEVATYSKGRIPANKLNAQNYVGVEN